MKRVLIVGAGDVARRATPWLVRRFRVYVLLRNRAAAPAWRSLGAVPVIADLDDRHSLKRLAGLAQAVLHFAPPPATGEADPRTARLLAALARRGSVPRRLVYISTTGVYGDCAGQAVDETRPRRAQTARARRRVDAEDRLRAFGRRNAARVALLRAPGIYAADRLPLERLRRGDPVLDASEDVHTNHIHADDLARLACTALFRARGGRAFNAVDHTQMTMGAYLDLAADTFGLPRPPRMMRAEIATRLSPTTMSFMSESRVLSNARILRELRVRLKYPTVREGFRAALAKEKTHPCS